MTRFLKCMAAVAAILLATGEASAHPHKGSNTTTIKNSGNGTGNTIQVHSGGNGGHRGNNTTTVTGSGNGTGNTIGVHNGGKGGKGNNTTTISGSGNGTGNTITVGK